MTKSKELKLGVKHIRIIWFSFRLQYLKLSIKIYGVISKFRSKLKNKSYICLKSLNNLIRTGGEIC